MAKRPDNYYAATTAAWNDRLGVVKDYADTKNTLVKWLAGLLALSVSINGLQGIKLANRPVHIEKIYLDAKTGLSVDIAQHVAAAQTQVGPGPDRRVIEASLRQYIESLRKALPSPAEMESNQSRVWAMSGQAVKAQLQQQLFIGDQAHPENPYNIAARYEVRVQVTYIGSLGDEGRFSVDWRETWTSLSTGKVDQDRSKDWKATVAVAIASPEAMAKAGAAVLAQNPYGLVVTSLDMRPVLTPSLN